MEMHLPRHSGLYCRVFRPARIHGINPNAKQPTLNPRPSNIHNSIMTLQCLSFLEKSHDSRVDSTSPEIVVFCVSSISIDKAVSIEEIFPLSRSIIPVEPIVLFLLSVASARRYEALILPSDTSVSNPLLGTQTATAPALLSSISESPAY